MATPHRPQTNGVAERMIRRIIEGRRCCLLASGLGHSWWREAMQGYCILRNVRDVVRDGKTPYELRHGDKFRGVILPFGTGIEYKPSSDREVSMLQKFGPKTRKGILVGYHLHNGGRWSGDYLVVDSHALKTSSSTETAYAHRVKEIVHDGIITFPARDGSLWELDSVEGI